MSSHNKTLNSCPLTGSTNIRKPENSEFDGVSYFNDDLSPHVLIRMTGSLYSDGTSALTDELKNKYIDEIKNAEDHQNVFTIYIDGSKWN
jgi:hypothetical protein